MGAATLASFFDRMSIAVSGHHTEEINAMRHAAELHKVNPRARLDKQYWFDSTLLPFVCAAYKLNIIIVNGNVDCNNLNIRTYFMLSNDYEKTRWLLHNGDFYEMLAVRTQHEAYPHWDILAAYLIELNAAQEIALPEVGDDAAAEPSATRGFTLSPSAKAWDPK